MSTNIPGTRVAYLDGGMTIPRLTTQPRVIVLGPASSGPSYDLYSVGNVSEAERRFGADTTLLRRVHELISQGANNVSLIRIGGSLGTLVVEDSAGNTLTITPSDRDDTILDRYALFIENDGTSNRYLVYDLEDETYVYDTSNIECLDNGIVSVVDTGIDLFTLNDRTDITTAISLGDLVTGDFTADGDETVSTVTVTPGADGLTSSLVEKYAAYNSGYHMLSYKLGSYVVPCDIYIDDANVADDASPSTYGYFWGGLPVAGSDADKLGYVWQYVYRGRVYTYFTDTADYFSVAQAAASKTVLTTLVLTAERDGKGGNANTIQVATGGSPSCSITENADGGLDIYVVAQSGSTTTSQAATLINNALTAFTSSQGTNGASLVSAAGGVTVISTTVAKSNFTGGTGGHVLTHEDLTGDAIPSAVSTKFAAGSDSQLREVNFAHQLASFCYQASADWNDLIGAISFKAPDAYSFYDIADWVGDAPTYTDNGNYKYIDAPTDNGSGLLGHKLLAGFSKTSAGYRSHLVEDGNSTDGYAYGGLILTTGAALPNGTNYPYGIDSSDEAVDAKQRPVDIGKHIVVVGDWPVLTNSWDGGTSYRGDTVGVVIGKLATMPPNLEPMGDQGRLRKVQSPTNVHPSQLSDLIGMRIGWLVREEGRGVSIVKLSTAAHPDSDYVRISTIRCANDLIRTIREAARPYFGKPFLPSYLTSLQNDIEQIIVRKKGQSYIKNAKASLSYTRVDQILGRVTVNIKMFPTGSLEGVDLTLSMSAEEFE